ncbi:MAG TPA: hypothetical protein PKN36_07905 [bacterium]|nr:hypothetical protein [bacterium]
MESLELFFFTGLALFAFSLLAVFTVNFITILHGHHYKNGKTILICLVYMLLFSLLTASFVSRILFLLFFRE